MTDKIISYSGDKLEKNNQFQTEVNTITLSSKNFNIGARTGDSYMSDPKHLLFSLSRYKFVSKMFVGMGNILEVGCGDGFGAPVVSHVVNNLTATDLDERFIEKIKQTHPYNGTIDFVAHDMIKGSFGLEFDGIFSLDVLEHIDKEFENDFMFNIVESIKSDGVCIIGMPSLESQMYASKISKLGHVNCKTGEELKIFLENFFERVFMFSMNDEIVHTGFQPMAHYLLALCVVPKKT